jgi:hypothetical protein
MRRKLKTFKRWVEEGKMTLDGHNIVVLVTRSSVKIQLVLGEAKNIRPLCAIVLLVVNGNRERR